MSDSPCESVLPRMIYMNGELRARKHSVKDSVGQIKKAVVVLTRLPDYKVSALRPPTPPQFYSEDESLSSSDSDMQWEPDEDSSDSDFSVSNNKPKVAKLPKTNAAGTPMPSTSSSNNNGDNNSGVKPSFSGHWAHDKSKVRPNLPEVEVKVGMMVLARRMHMKWRRGKVSEIVTREDGRLKYKVSFEEKGKSLVSGHHIAFDTTPTLEQLYVGARVVVQCQENNLWFRPAILAELPSRKNHLRFLIFMDDHTPTYVGLPVIHLVCRPLEDVTETLSDGYHKYFIKQYLKDWPYPHLTQYKAGETSLVELNGEKQRCDVKAVDCSLMQVLFQDAQHQEWIHRGSFRLEQHMARLLQLQGEVPKPEDTEEDE